MGLDLGLNYVGFESTQGLRLGLCEKLKSNLWSRLRSGLSKGRGRVLGSKMGLVSQFKVGVMSNSRLGLGLGCNTSFFERDKSRKN